MVIASAVTEKGVCMKNDFLSLISNDDMPLHEKLDVYADYNVYPFHMPGHKRQEMGLSHPERIDITEIEGFDNLNHAEGILKEEQAHMARVFGADKSFFLVNGSTVGVITAMFASVARGGKIIVSRNCHKSAYNGILLRELEAVYVYPRETISGIQGSIAPEDIEAALKANPDAGAVFITSPTFDGVVSDIEKISEIVHGYNIPLIVDEAHGAHFGFSDKFPKKAISLGADVVIESMHKTLPAYTQTAALHVKGDRVNPAEIQKYLSIFQTTSPSYILMSGLTQCTCIMEQHGKELMDTLYERLIKFYENTKDLKCLEVFQPEDTAPGADPAILDRDISKILVFCRRAGISGKVLYERLSHDYGIQMEVAAGDYVNGLTSPMDTQEGFDRLEKALKELDEEYSARAKEPEVQAQKKEIHSLRKPHEKAAEIYEANETPKVTVSMKEAEGKVSGEFVYLYPPGIPFIVPGEVIPEGFAESVSSLKSSGYIVQGLEDMSAETIKILKD